MRARPGGVREAVEARLPERRATPPGGHGGQDHHDRRQVSAVAVALLSTGKLHRDFESNKD